MGNQLFRLKDILYYVRKHINIIIFMTVGGLLIGVLFHVVQSFSRSNQTMYKVFVSFSVGTSNADGNYTNNMKSPGANDFTLASTLVDWTSYIVRSEKVCKTAVERLGLIGVTTKSVQRALSVSTYGKTSIMELSLVWQNSEEGVEIMETVMDILPGAIRSILNVGDINKIEGPVVTTISTASGNKSVFLFPALSLLGSLLYCFAQMYMHPTLIDIKDVGDMFGVNTLSVIDDDPAFEDFLRENLITNRENLSSSMKDNFTAFAHILMHQIDDDYFSLFVTSSIHGEGKTMVVANLGISLAALDKRVLLIDFDLTSPSLGSFFMDDVNYKNTVNAVYFDDVSVSDALVRVSPNLYLLMASLDKRPIGIDRFAKKLVAQLETEFDVVILDTPPLGENSDTLYFNTVSKNALYVIRYDYAACDVISENIEKLNKAGTSLLGAVINRVPTNGGFQLNFKKFEHEEEDKESIISQLYHKLPFAKKKEPVPPKQRIKASVDISEEEDSFESDNDLVDPEDYEVILSAGKPETDTQEAAVSSRRKSSASLADDTDDERLARVEAVITRMGADEDTMRPDSEKQPPAAPQKPEETAVKAEAKTKQAPAKKKEPAQKNAPPQQPIVEPSAEDVYEDEDEDARFARIFSTHINYLDDNDDRL